MLVLVIITSVSNASGADQLQELSRKAGIQTLAEGDSAAELQKQTTAAIPFNVLTSQNRARVRMVLDNCSQYRRLPMLQFTIDEPIYRYLMEHPDVAVSTWRAMGISRFEMLQTGPQEYEAKAIDGSEGIADILYQDQNQTLFICDGSYHNMLLPRPLQAAALIWFRATYEPNADGTHVVTQKVDVFVRFPSTGVSTVAKLLTPVTNSMMDRNLFEISLYASMMSRAVHDEPEWIVQIAQQMDGVLPQRKGELISVARKPRAAALRNASGPSNSKAAERSIVMSPQLLFFDPPKDGSSTVAGTSSVSGAQSQKSGTETQGARPSQKKSPSQPPEAGLEIIPAARASATRQNTNVSETPASELRAVPESQFKLQPAVPPAGPTATGPVGSGPAVPGGL